MKKNLDTFRSPSRFEHWFNAFVALLAKLGITFRDGYRLIVIGRRSGKQYAVAVTALSFQGQRYLVAPRGETQWVRNARAAGQVTLEKGSSVQRFDIAEICDEQKNAILAEYLNQYQKAVQRYFPIPAGAEPEAFEEIADYFPVFLLTPKAMNG